MFTNYNRNKNIVFSFLTIVQLKMSNYETILKYHNITYNRNGPNFFFVLILLLIISYNKHVIYVLVLLLLIV